MKYFNDIRYEDIKELKPNNIMSISQYFDEWQDEHYERLDSVIGKLKEIATIGCCAFIRILKDFKDYKEIYYVNMNKVCNDEVINRKKISESLWTIETSEFFELLKKIYSQPIQWISINYYVYKGKFYVDLESYYWKLYVLDKDNTNIIQNKKYLWFGKIYGGKMEDKYLGTYNFELTHTAFIENCKIKELRYRYDDSNIPVLFIRDSKIKKISIEVTGRMLELDIRTSEVSEISINFSKLREDISYPIMFNGKLDNVNLINIHISKEVKEKIGCKPHDLVNFYGKLDYTNEVCIIEE